MTAENRLTTKINTHADAVLHCFQSMDLEGLGSLLDGGLYCSNSKGGFLKNAQETFDYFKEQGDTYLNRHVGVCTGYTCARGKGWTFVGNHSGHGLHLVFDIEEGEVKSFYDCCNFKTHNEHITLVKRIKVYDFWDNGRGGEQGNSDLMRRTHTSTTTP